MKTTLLKCKLNKYSYIFPNSLIAEENSVWNTMTETHAGVSPMLVKIRWFKFVVKLENWDLIQKL